MKLIVAIIQPYKLPDVKQAPNPPPKKRYGYFGLLEGAFFKNFRKSSGYYCDLTRSLLIGYF